MNNDKPLTGVRKRAQIANTNKQILIWVGVASSLVVICIVFAINFIQDIAYQIKVNSELSTTASTLSTSVDNIPKLITSVGNLSTDQSLTLQNINSYTDAGGNHQTIPAQQVVLYSMPTISDPTSLAVALQNLLSSAGATVTQITMGNSSATSTTTDTTTTSSSNANNPTPQAIQFTISLGGNPNDGSIQKALTTLENMTRVITVNSITTQSGLTTIQATAYFTPRVNYQTGTEEVQP
jgi:hypothetical protein